MTNDTGSDAYKLLLTVGFVSISVAILAAYLTPARGYEVSVYGALHGVEGTPLTYWIGLGIALFASVVVTFAATARRVRNTAYGLGVFSFMSLVMLPLVRSWHYHAGSDALSHLGFSRELSNGISIMADTQYPHLHTVVVFLSGTTGTELERTFLMVVPAFVLIFVLFPPLTARLFSNDRWIVGTAVFSGMLLLPINHISGDLTPQPSSQAMLYVTFALYLLVLMMMDRDRRAALLLTIVAFTMVLLHPLHAASLILLFVSIAGVQWVHTSLHRSGSFLPSRPVFLQASLLTLFFWIWVQAIIAERFERNFTRMIESMLVDTETAESVQGRSVSLEILGGSLEEMFVKMFLISVVYCAICGLLMGASVIETFFSWSKRLQSLCRSITFRSDIANTVLAYWTVGFGVASALFFIYVFGGISDQYMRHYGFLMATVTIVGALAVGQILKRLAGRFSTQKAVPLAVIFVIACLLLTMPVAFSSPHIYQESHHISEKTMEGHATAFDNTDDDVLHTSVRRGVHRYQNAILRGDDPRRDYETDYRTGYVADHFSNQELQGFEHETAYHQDLHGYFNEPAYLFVKEKDRTFETTVLQGFRWSEDDFAYLEEEPGVNRVQDNGGFTLYAIEDREPPDERSSQ